MQLNNTDDKSTNAIYKQTSNPGESTAADSATVHPGVPPRLLILLLVFLPMLNNCSSEKAALKPPPENPIELRVENHAAAVIDVIEAKPCGSDDKQYRPQMEAIKPNQRIMLHIYQDCVDLVARDGFGNVMDELVGLRMNSNITWKIK
ncbi:MAG: hypothetical protein LJE85_05345 [Gammaproteobacteria bacterium]|nr:hypothetical protein [Gammaproteobacteria bacterium]